MARNFNGTTDKLQDGSPTILDNIFNSSKTTIFEWVNTETDGEGNFGQIIDKTDGSDASRLRWIHGARGDDGTNYEFDFLKGFTGTQGAWRTTNKDGTLNQWDCSGMEYDGSDVANDAVFFINGTSVSVTKLVTPVGSPGDDSLRILTIGNNTNAARTFDGSISHVALWSAGLGATKQSALSRGVNPFIMDHDNLLMFVPLGGVNSPESDYKQNATDFTVTGTTKPADNPPVELLENYL